MLKKVRALASAVMESRRISEAVEALRVQLAREALERLRREPRHQAPKSLIPHGYKIYSQNEEDGLIREVFARVGTTNRVFVEFGVGTGLENNTLALLLEGWTGLWIEADDGSVGRIREGLAGPLAAGRLRLLHSFITRENVDGLIASALPAGEIDFLSVDIDGNDFEVFCAIACVRPRVVSMEYNAKFRPPVSFCMAYDAGHAWRGDDCFGASLSFLEKGLAGRGYRLVGCDLTGTNAFFVREDLVGDKFLEPFTAQNHYEPPRDYLGQLAAGPPASFKAASQAILGR